MDLADSRPVPTTREVAVPALDLLQYRDFDSIDVDLNVGDNAGEKLGSGFEGLYVVAVGPPLHEGKDATVVLAHEHRPERMQELKNLVGGA
jgi:hypothetical protein